MPATFFSIPVSLSLQRNSRHENQAYMQRLYPCNVLWRASQTRCFIPTVPFPMLPNIPVIPSVFGICYHSAKMLTGSERAVKFEPQAVATKILPLSLSGERNFRAKLDSPKPYTVLAYETKMTDPTDDAYKKSQHDEER